MNAQKDKEQMNSQAKQNRTEKKEQNKWKMSKHVKGFQYKFYI